PDIAGQGIANPLALLLAACLMLDHVGKRALAQTIRNAVSRTLNEDGVRTKDLGGSATTAQFTRAIAKRL
ncbi:MAG TPA: isocitrate/isopropylmalate family dehydrogenase, partial [Burkholderiales bacterium]|nr:isocitrate/isopropylmalate family dehydrogenase [Burkholderiales bacterium]